MMNAPVRVPDTSTDTVPDADTVTICEVQERHKALLE